MSDNVNEMSIYTLSSQTLCDVMKGRQQRCEVVKIPSPLTASNEAYVERGLGVDCVLHWLMRGSQTLYSGELQKLLIRIVDSVFQFKDQSKFSVCQSHWMIDNYCCQKCLHRMLPQSPDLKTDPKWHQQIAFPPAS